MRDRIPTQVLENGAIRYGIYNPDGTLNRYEYIKAEDEPTEEGTPLNVATLLTDATATALGLSNTADATVDEALGKLRELVGTKASIAITSYVGSGGYGENAPCQLAFSSPPKVVFFLGYQDNYTVFYTLDNYTQGNGVLFPEIMSAEMKQSRGFCAGSIGYCYGQMGNALTIRWYNRESASAQLNFSGYQYYFLAIF